MLILRYLFQQIAKLLALRGAVNDLLKLLAFKKLNKKMDTNWFLFLETKSYSINGIEHIER